jgi:hypothetical protein
MSKVINDSSRVISFHISLSTCTLHTATMRVPMNFGRFLAWGIIVPTTMATMYQEDDVFTFSKSAVMDRARSMERIVLEHEQRRSLQQYETILDIENDEAEAASVALQTICMTIQQSFASAHDVTCTCAGHIADSFSISCDYATPVCNDDASSTTCGRPQIAVSMVQGKVFSATTCVVDYTRGFLTLQDTCVFVDACPDDASAFCDCTASYGGMICDTCRVCDGGQALTVDCSNVNAEAVSTQCRAVDLDWHLDAGAGHLAGFAPVFDGFCSQLEASLDNSIACDCTLAVGGTYDVSCQTTAPLCVHGTSNGTDRKNDDGDAALCGKVASTVHVVEGHMVSVTACASYDAPFGETCTTLQVCNGDNETSGSDDTGICECAATYNGQACQSCAVCADQASLTLDCSNVHPGAVTPQCQTVSSRTSYEFLPDYRTHSNNGLGFTSAAAASEFGKGHGTSFFAPVAMALLTTLLL